MRSTARRTLEYPVFHFWLTLALLLLATPAGADEIIMRDGSRLLGSVVKGEGATLGFKTSFAGVINIKWDQIAEINSEKPMEFLLSDDTIVSGTHVTNNVDELVLEGTSGQPSQTIAQNEIAVINPESWRKGEGYKISGLVNFAFSRDRGNTDKDEIDVDGDLTWRRKHDRFTAFGELERDRNNNKTTTDNWKLEGQYNYFVTKKWYWGGFGRLEHDKFADLDLRTSVGPLVGYQWFESKEINLRTSAGFSYVNENFISQSDDHYGAFAWGINFDKYLWDDFMQFYHRQTGFWNLKDTNDVVWDTWTGLRFPLVLGLVASTEMQVEYDSGAAKGAKDVDTTYSLKLGYQW